MVKQARRLNRECEKQETGIQYFSKDLLYHYKTDITKYVLMIMCSIVEIVSIIFSGITEIIQSRLHLANETKLNSLMHQNYDCSSPTWFLIYSQHPLDVLLQNICLFLVLFAILLICILSRYLAARYLHHPFKHILVKYISWYLFQGILLAFCSTWYTWFFLILLLPIICLINWKLLQRDTSILSRVLKSNITEIKLFSNNKVLYHRQLSAYKFYRIFRVALLISFLTLSLYGCLFILYRAIEILLFHRCIKILAWMWYFPTPLEVPIHIRHNIIVAIYFIDKVSLMIYSISSCLPLCLITFSPIVLKCMMRYTEKVDQYRYNYQTLQPLLRRKRYL